MKGRGRVKPGDLERWVGHGVDQAEEDGGEGGEIGGALAVLG